MDRMEAPNSTISTYSRLRITHALLELVAAEAGVRILHVKGTALHPELARGRHTSLDCDVLVEPSGVERYITALQERGWELMTTFEHGSVFEHAATLYHQVWGTVDVHRSFPGANRDAHATFALWWENRDQVELGGTLISVPSLLDQRLLLLLHSARSPGGRGSHDFTRSWSEATPGQRRKLEERAAAVGGTAPLLLLTDDGSGERRRRAMGDPEFHLWDAVVNGANATEVWGAMIQDAPTLRGKAGVMWKAAHVNRDHLALRLGHAPTAREVRMEWFDRLRRGARRLRAMALRGLRRHG